MNYTFEEIRDFLASLQPSTGQEPSSHLTESDLRSVEQSLGLMIPREIKDWLMVINGSFVGSQVFLGIGTSNSFLDLVPVLQDYPEWKSRAWIPVASDGCGNYYVASGINSLCPVVFVDTAFDFSKPAYVVSTALRRFLYEFIKSEFFDTEWPFDRKYILLHDPGLIDATGLGPLPWEG
ncbi:MAG: SMI1/KNR4 family protein [Candidatus Sumerlaeia bacterium]|nr:SMI1/KNR4 family protein [Candidatus Sumerlaeia bacterium]